MDVIGIPTGGQGRSLFIQCKHTARGTAGRIGEGAVWDLVRARQNHQAAHANPILVAVTNGRFALAAEHLAQAHGVHLFEADSLMQLGRALRRLSDGVT